MEVPAERKSVNKASISFQLVNDLGYDVKGPVWVDFSGMPDSRPERENDNVKAGQTIGCGTNTGHPFAFYNLETGGEVACVCFTTELASDGQPHRLSDAVALSAAATTPLSVGGFRLKLDNEAWQDIVKEVGPSGVVLIRRPFRDIRIISRLKKIASRHDWEQYTHAFVYGGRLLGLCLGDGSRAQAGAVSIMLDDDTLGAPAKCISGPESEYAVPGLRSMTAVTVPVEVLEKVSVVHHLIQYQTLLVPAATILDGTAPELNHGFQPVPAAVLSESERRRFLWNQHEHGQAGDSSSMLEELASRGLGRDPGMPDYYFVQRLASRLRDHIKYHAGNDCQNNGKPPSNAFKTGWGQCGRFSAVLVSACRANGIPARVVTNGLEGESGKLFDPAFMHACAEVFLEGAGWTLIEPQGGTLGDFTRFIALDTCTHTQEQLADAKVLHPGLGGQVDQLVSYYFNKFDVDRNDKLEGDEVRAFLSDALGIQSGTDINLFQIDEAMAALDVDQSGSLTRAELTKALAEESLRVCGRAYSVGQSTCGGSLLRCLWPPADTKGLMGVPEERRSINKESVVFAIHNDSGRAVRQVWVDFQGEYDSRPERQNDIVAPGTTSCGGANTGHPFAFIDVETGAELACVVFTVPFDQQNPNPAKLSDAMQLCGTAPLVDSGAAPPLPLPGSADAESRLCVMPSVESRFKEAERCGYSREQNPYNPDHLAANDQPVVSLEYDKVEVRRLDPVTGSVVEEEASWGHSDEPPQPAFSWPKVPLYVGDRGCITMPEYLVFAQDFAAWDKEGRGTLGRDNAKDMIKAQLGRAPSSEELSDVFAVIDSNGDGSITLDEYILYINGQLP